MNKYYVIYKPYGMLSQFSESSSGTVLSELAYDFPKDVYPVGRLDKDSEGLLIITNDKYLHTHLLDPLEGHKRTYWVQVEGDPTKTKLRKLEDGPEIRVNKKMHKCLPGKVKLFSKQPDVPDRDPPIRFRKSVETHWLSISIREGKNRQVRKMTASAELFTLRLIRFAIEDLNIENFKVGDVEEYSKEGIYNFLKL